MTDNEENWRDDGTQDDWMDDYLRHCEQEAKHIVLVGGPLDGCNVPYFPTIYVKVSYYAGMATYRMFEEGKAVYIGG